MHSEKILVMRIFIIVLVLIFNLQSLTRANDIMEFEIEGISIGDSLLDFFSEEEINNNIEDYYNDNKYKLTEFYKPKNFTQYDSLKFHYNSKDQNFKIISISGINFYKNNILKCHDDMKEIDKEISSLFINLERNTEDQIHPADNTGKSTTKAIRYWFSDRSLISIVCYDWSEELYKKNAWTDNLQLEISLNEFNKWLKLKAFN